MPGKTITALIVLLMAMTVRPVSAQFFDESTQVKYDTNYIQVYKDELTIRTYVSRKQNGVAFSESLLNQGIRYKTNDNLVWGIGYTYSFLTLNLSLKLPVINRDDDIYGRSKYFDLQSHTIFRSYIIDLYLQWNKGYYLSNPEQVIPNWDPVSAFPSRSDMRTNILGLNVQYLVNSERFSYKASFLQNEFQKKSAGSPILGLEGYWMLGMADSMIIPPALIPSDLIGGELFNQVDIANVGVNGGYAYTFVWRERLYWSLSSVFGLSAAYNQIHYTPYSATFSSGMTVGVNNSTRISLGYNSQNYYIGLSFIYFSMKNRVPGEGDWITYNTGNIRFNVVRRFRLRRSIRILRPDLWIF